MTEAEDSRFDEAEADVDHGNPWMFRDSNAPNPLTIIATEWSEGVTKLGPAEWLQGVDRDGKRWSVLVGSVILTKRLIDGVVEQWDDERKEFIVVKTEGRVQPGEVVSIYYVGDIEGARYTYPSFRVSRKPATGATMTSLSSEVDMTIDATPAAEESLEAAGERILELFDEEIARVSARADAHGEWLRGVERRREQHARQTRIRSRRLGRKAERRQLLKLGADKAWVDRVLPL